MPLVIRTKEDSTEAVAISGVGTMGAGGKGGIVAEEAALVMSEFQEKDDQGVVVLDGDGNPKPLKGAALEEAVKTWAAERGFSATKQSDAKVAALPREMGAAPDRPPAAECAAEDYARFYGNDPVNDEPESQAQVEGTSSAGAADTGSGAGA